MFRTGRVRRFPARSTATVAARRVRGLREVSAPAVLGAALLLTAGLWVLLQRAEPYLGHDESVYAGQARALATGAPTSGWMVYRPVGLPLIGSLALRLHPGTTTLRVVGLLLALATLVVVYRVGSALTTPRRSAVAVLVVLSGTTFLRRLPEFLDDLSSAGLLLLTAYLVLRSRRPGGRWALPAAGVTAVVTVLVRYGAAAGLIAIVAAAVLVWGPRVWLRAWREVAVAAAVVVAGLAPLAVYSRQETGSVLGLMVQAEVTAHRDYLGQGLVYYAQAFPVKLAGPLGALVVLAGLGASVGAARQLLAARGRARAVPVPTGTGPGVPADATGPARERVFLAVAAVGELLLLGIVAHGESRFVLFTVVTLVVLGVDAIARAAGPRRVPVLALTAAAAVLLTGITTVLVYRQVRAVTGPVAAVAQVAAQLTPATSPTPERAPASALPALPGRTATGTGCLVVTRLAVEAAWVSGCRTLEPDQVTAARIGPGFQVYVIDFPGRAHWSGLRRVQAVAPSRTWTLRRVPSSGQFGDAVVAVSAPLGVTTAG